MNVFKDSISRCLGVETSQEDDICANILPLSAQPKGVSGDFNQDSGISDEEDYATLDNQTGKEWDNIVSGFEQNRNMRQSNEEYGFEEDLSKALDKAALQSKPRRRSRVSKNTFSSSSPSSQHASLRRTEVKCKKRKSSIFRQREDEGSTQRSSAAASIASLILGKRNANVSSILCFANPVYEEEEVNRINKIRRTETIGCDSDLDADTISSTIFFDSKYDNIIESKAPVPLFNEYLVPENCDKENAIREIFESGSHKSIKTIQCHYGRGNQGADALSQGSNVSPSYGISLYDGTSSDSFDSDVPDHTYNTTNRKRNNNTSVRGQASPRSTGGSTRSDLMHTPERGEYVSETTPVSDWVFTGSTDPTEANNLPNLKLVSKSSVSTAALTPTCSTVSHASSPMQESRRKQFAGIYSPQRYRESDLIEQVI
eukprot:CAMPEP_0184869976 /NCGR_PEP_ID=MMETSP0580-20130426/36046_1 /TAXON_ID=1118495 /ORGANISM="Dactyliosolen fragilissimus" /LENGTH=428 /DNA_ID=CAMNT_0027371829 /DNA_START=288 /DNA_END=1574 /DNA_ORIENTATION=+